MNSDNLLPIVLQHSLFFSIVEEKRKDKTASPVFYYYYLILNFMSTIKNIQLLTSCFSVTELSGQAPTPFSGLLREGNKMTQQVATTSLQFKANLLLSFIQQAATISSSNNPDLPTATSSVALSYQHATSFTHLLYFFKSVSSY